MSMAWERIPYKGDNVVGKAHERSWYVCVPTDTATPGWAFNIQRKVPDKHRRWQSLHKSSNN